MLKKEAVSDLTLTEIRAFNATIQLGNFTRAADLLGVSQPAVTAQIRKIEGRFDTPLLERTGKGVKPTDLGQRLYKITRQYVDLDASVQSLIHPAGDERSLEIRIATASPLVFMPLLAAFRQQYPEATLKITSGTTDECREHVLARDVDIGLFPLPKPGVGLSCLTFHSHQLVAIIHPEHLLAQGDSVSVNELINESLIFSRRRSFTQQMVDTAFASEGLTPSSNILIDVRSDICEAVAQGLGVGFALSHDIRPDPGYCAVPIKEAGQEVLEHLVWLKSRTHLPEIKLFVEMALEMRSRQFGELSDRSA